MWEEGERDEKRGQEQVTGNGDRKGDVLFGGALSTFGMHRRILIGWS